MTSHSLTEKLAPSSEEDRPSGTRRIAHRSSRDSDLLPLSKRRLRALLIEDDPGDAMQVRKVLGSGQLTVELKQVQSLEEAFDVIETCQFDVMFLDLGLPDATGMDAVRQLIKRNSSAPTIVLSGASDLTTAVDALAVGAQDYIEKSKLSSDALERAVRYSLERKRYEKQLEYLAAHDQLTGLANRHTLLTRLSRALERAERGNHQVTAIHIDLDRFHVVNEGLGHQAGDQLIFELGRRISEAVEGFAEPQNFVQPIVAHLGGGAFCVVLEEVHHETEVTDLVSRILRDVSVPLPIEGEVTVSTASVGLAFCPGDAKVASDLLKRSELAMRKAKRRGGNTSSFFDRNQEVSALRDLRLERDLRRGLELEEFALFYQPQFELASGELCGAEALLRWHRRTGELVSPGEFIPALERTGLIVEVGTWVLRKVCKQLKNELADTSLRIAVNVSALQLQCVDAAERILQVVHESGVDPSRIELELTESLLQENSTHVQHVLHRLRSAGFCIALDDFGTGYSSLAYLKQFPIDVLKIDGSFITEIGTDQPAWDLAGSIIEVGHKLGMSVVAERIETEEQLDYLKKNGCDVGQGFLLGKPGPLTDLFAESR